MRDGHLNKCKSCTKSDVRKREEVLRNDADWVESEKERAREKYYRLGYKEKHKPTREQAANTLRKYRSKYPEKIKAHQSAQRIKVDKNKHKHHWSYNEEHFRDVIILDEKEHAKVHRHLTYDQENKIYKSVNGDILDTREKHERFIKHILSNYA